MSSLLIYGANGYTGQLIARQAVRHGLQPVLAGRNASSVRSIADELGVDARSFGLDDSKAIEAVLRDVAVVLHCAGPFSRTSRPMVEACLASRVHYLDITGEIEVFEAVALRDAEARSRGVMLLPGVGFDVVPSDCLASHLKRRLPTATHLALGFSGGAGLSRGTATTALSGIGLGGAVRRGGTIVAVPAAWRTRSIDFGTGPRSATTIPWGDVATAFYSTRIPNIEVYMAMPIMLRIALRVSAIFSGLLRTGPVKRLVQRRIDRGSPGPSDAARGRTRSRLWGEVRDGEARCAVSRLLTPEGYTLTALTAVAVAERVLQGDAPAGFQTPATAYGPDFILGIDGVVREDD